MTLLKQTSLFIEDQLTSLQEDSLVNHTQVQESDLAMKMNATSGQKCLEEVQPRWVVGENVLGLTNWNGGLVFNEVQVDLEAKGYEVQAFILPACAKNAPHRRDRVWFVAYSNQIGFSTKMANGKLGRKFGFTKCDQSNVWDTFSIESAICGEDDGLPTQLDSITLSKYRKESLMAYGNAIVPQVAYEIFKAINEFELMVNK
jgi:DNA (cytosine-5)-methyltransferase 1